MSLIKSQICTGSQTYSSHSKHMTEQRDKIRATDTTTVRKGVGAKQRAQNSAPGSPFGSTQHQNQPKCKSRAAGRHYVHNAAQMPAREAEEGMRKEALR